MIAFNAIVFETTSRCNARCQMCYQGAGPKGSDYLGDAALTFEDVAHALDQMAGIARLPRRVHFGGGEGFLDAPLLIACIRHARQAGFRQVTAVSNCFWGSSAARADSIARDLAAAGLDQMEISWDVWHAPYVPAVRVATAIRALHGAGVNTNLRLLTTRAVRANEALDMLGADILPYLDEVAVGNVLPTGKAAVEFPPDELYGGQSLDAGCRTNLNFTVNPRGDVAPCCSGADQTPNLCFGNIRTEAIAEILARMDASVMLLHLVNQGSRQFLEVLRAHGLDLGPDERFSGPCHACWTIFSDDRAARIIESVFEPLKREALHDIMREYSLAQLRDGFALVLVSREGLAACQDDPAARLGLGEMLASYPERSLVILGIRPGDEAAALLADPGLLGRLSTVHVALEPDDDPDAIAALLEGLHQCPVTLNLMQSLARPAVEALARCGAPFINLTINVGDLDQADLSRILALETVSRWGVTVFRSASRPPAGMSRACEGRLNLCIGEGGRIFCCPAMMHSGIGALGALDDLAGLVDLLRETPEIDEWRKNGPDLPDSALAAAQGNVCRAHLTEILGALAP